jgi:hypothetical protein
MTRYSSICITAFFLNLFISCNSNNETVTDGNAGSYDYNVDGFVPDKNTALKIAEAVWIPIYGNKVLEQKPYRSSLVGDSVWIVEGTLKAGFVGGTAYVEISKKDCKILKVTHGK